MISAHRAPSIAPKASVGRKIPPVAPEVLEMIIPMERMRNSRMRTYQAAPSVKRAVTSP